jgi:4-hydroxybenzoate polyprenyltransferase
MTSPNVLRKLEAVAWMTRFHRLSSPLLISVAGWYAGEEQRGGWRLAAFIGYVGCQAGAAMILNDLLDREADAVTNDQTPLPQGVVSPLAAATGVVVCAVGGVLLVLAASPEAGARLLGCGFAVGTVVVSVLYSRFKAAGAVASALAAIPFGFAALAGVVLGGGAPARTIVPLAAYALLRGFFTNIAVALRDIDGDPLVGVRTVPVRVGAPRAFTWCCAASVGLAGLVIWLAVDHDHPWPAVPAAAVAIALVAAVASGIYRELSRPNRTRADRLAVLRAYDQERLIVDAGLVAAFAPVAGIVTGLLFEALWVAGTAGYTRRRDVILGAEPA